MRFWNVRQRGTASYKRELLGSLDVHTSSPPPTHTQLSERAFHLPPGRGRCSILPRPDPIVGSWNRLLAHGSPWLIVEDFLRKETWSLFNVMPAT